mgnify:CR=1 FL=1
MVKKGDNVGYDLGWKASKDSMIATLPIGHADGIGRHFGNEKAWVSVTFLVLMVSQFFLSL